MHTRITNYLRAGYPGLYLVTAEEQRAEAELRQAVQATGHKLVAWSATTGMLDTESGSSIAGEEPMEAVMAINTLPDNTVAIFRDLHTFIEDPNPVLVRAIKDTLLHCKATGKCLVMVGCRRVLPPELEREITTIELQLPGSAQLGEVLSGICESASLEPLMGDQREAVLEAASGLTCSEAENIFALCVVGNQAIQAVQGVHPITPAMVARLKADTIRQNGLLEVVEEEATTLKSIGGLEILKEWLLQRQGAFGHSAIEYGLPSPKGVLILGVPGTGKSLTAKATAAVLGRPLLKLDAGKLFGSLVGQSEANLRSAINTAESMSPCVLWIDELEKGFSGSYSSGATDGGTGSRVFGTFLSWMQEKKSPVFVVATANDVTQLPPELLRKGRWDELFFTDLPNVTEREAIWQIQIRKYGRNPATYNINKLVAGSQGFTGAEIEQAVIDALYAGFTGQREPDTNDLLRAVEATVPLSKLMADQIQGLHNWSKGRCRTASRIDGTQETAGSTKRKIDS